MKRYYLTQDLINDADLIKAYEKWHQNIWPEIRSSITESGIEEMEIYRFEDRLVMVMTVNDSFSFEKKSAADQSNARVQEWEKLMWKYQKPLPGTKLGAKWLLMNKIFEL